MNLPIWNYTIPEKVFYSLSKNYQSTTVDKNKIILCVYNDNETPLAKRKQIKKTGICLKVAIHNDHHETTSTSKHCVKAFNVFVSNHNVLLSIYNEARFTYIKTATVIIISIAVYLFVVFLNTDKTKAGNMVHIFTESLKWHLTHWHINFISIYEARLRYSQIFSKFYETRFHHN